MVFCLYCSPGFNTTGGKYGRLGLSGKCCASKQMPLRRGKVAWEGCSVLSLVSRGPVVGVELYAWLRGIYFHGSATHGLGYLCGERQFSRLFFVEHEAVVIAASVLYLFVISVYVLANGFWRAEVERRSFHFQYFSRRDRSIVNGDAPVGIEVLSMGMKKSALISHMRLSMVGVGSAMPANEKKP